MTESKDSTKVDRDNKPMVEPSAPPPNPPLSFPFDVVVVADNGSEKNLTPTEFFALPLAERIKYVVQQKASFFADGRSIDSKEVLGHMRKMRANLH